MERRRRRRRKRYDKFPQHLIVFVQNINHDYKNEVDLWSLQPPKTSRRQQKKEEEEEDDEEEKKNEEKEEEEEEEEEVSCLRGDPAEINCPSSYHQQASVVQW